MRKLNKPFIEVDRIEVVSHFSQRYMTWCAGCRESVELVTVDEAAEISGTSVDSVIARAASGKIHLGIRPEALLFCVNSLVESTPAVTPELALSH